LQFIGDVTETARSVIKVSVKPFQRLAPIQRAERWSPLASGETSRTGGVVAPTTTPWCVCGVSFLLSFCCFKKLLGLPACRERFRQNDFAFRLATRRIFCASCAKEKSGYWSKICLCRKRGTPTCAFPLFRLRRNSPLRGAF